MRVSCRLTVRAAVTLLDVHPKRKRYLVDGQVAT
jgi:hypothetical protein